MQRACWIVKVDNLGRSSERTVIHLAIHIPKNDIALKIHTKCSGRWWGCNWPTLFGPLKLNLQNIRARQAKLVAEATSGHESQAWQAAVHYLNQIETDAELAEQLACEAIAMIERDQWSAALKLSEDAVSLEAKYRTSEVWCQLRDEIAAYLNRCETG